MVFTKEMVEEYADKLLIGLTEEENKLVLEEFSVIDKNISLINEIEDINKVVPMTHPIDNFTCALREDVASESVAITDLLANCDEYSGREVEVVKVVN